ncbi:hypothetical protein DCC62_00505 [candidate division KSB1 bacterium]|nr:MAG: hypothetical protein DCC62_00505 [candidate division KSB1 bacterium]
MLDQETKRKIDSARDILVGKVPDPKAQVEQITTALIYKFMDDMDKQAGSLPKGKPQFFTNGFEKYAWSKLLDPKLGGQERLNLYGEAITRMSKNPHLPQLFRDVFKDAFLPYRDPETLNLFLKDINTFEYDHSENLGDAFEYLLSVLGSQGEAGQFRTPRHIIDFIVEVVDPKKDETILDPACGTAGFLISAYKHILKANKNKPLTPDEKKRLMANLAGYDISPDMVKLSLVNMYLHGFPSPRIHEYDTLSSEERWDERFDVMMANPPFMTPKGGTRPHKRFMVQANRSEVLFVDYIMEHLNNKGRAGIIVPEGIIFQSARAYKQLRKLLVEDGLYAVVSLPGGVFNPYAGVKTSILFFDNQLSKQTKDILFIKVLNDGFDLGAQRRPIDRNDLPRAVEVLRAQQEAIRAGKKNRLLKEGSLFGWAVSKAKIAEADDYNLSGELYRTPANHVVSSWLTVSLGDLEHQRQIQFLRGQGLSKSELSDTGQYRCIHYGEIYTLYDPIIRQVFSKTDKKGNITSCNGDVLVPATTTADAMGIAVARSLNEEGVVIGGDINIIRTGNNTVLSDYLALLISNPPLKLELARFAKGVNILHLSNSDLRKLKIPLPPLEVQKEIVDELDGYQKVIDGAKQIIAHHKPSFRINPKWKTVELGNEELFKIESGGTPGSQNQEYWNGGIRWATLVDLPAENFITEINETERNISEAGLKNSSAKLLPEDSILVSSRATIGRVGINKVKLATNQGFKNVIVKKRDEIDPYYVAIVITTLVPEMESMASGGTFKEISKSNFAKLKLPLPSTEEQHSIVTDFKTEQKHIESAKRMIELYEEKIKSKIAEVWGTQSS